MDKRFYLLAALSWVFYLNAHTQNIVRTKISIPDIQGYKTLKCDFHMHTVFSDGKVWPTVRVQEAWIEGLDAIAITDHIEYHPHEHDVTTDNNRSYEVAKQYAKNYGILLIKGSEITRKMPPGHLNAIFLKDSEKLNIEDSIMAIAQANDQGAFVFWNHPSYPHPKNIEDWSGLHDSLFRNKQFKGIEVANGAYYYPKAHAWCLEKGLTMMSTSDVHNPITFDYNFENNEHRPINLVFAKGKTENDIKEALLNQRTAVYWQHNLIGKEEFLIPIFEKSISAIVSNIEDKENGKKLYVQIENKSTFPLNLKIDTESIDFQMTPKVKIHGQKTIFVEIDGVKNGDKNISIPIEVENFWIAPETALKTALDIGLE